MICAQIQIFFCYYNFVYIVHTLLYFFVCLNTTKQDYQRVVKTFKDLIKIVLKVRVPGIIMNVKLWYAYTHSLTSSSSENLHELLSSVIILVPLAESASMSCGVSAAWNIGTLSSAVDSKMQRSCQGFIEPLKWVIFTDFRMECTSTHSEAQSAITNDSIKLYALFPLWSDVSWSCAKSQSM